METVLGWLSDYGTIALFLGTFLSCLALPVPSSLMMLTSGALVASGDLDAIAVISAAYGGALLGDALGFAIGKLGGTHLDDWSIRHPKRGAALTQARARLCAKGSSFVFFSRWLFSPLGPYVNVVAGASGMHYRRFAIWDAAGEAVWVSLYIGLGIGFASNIGAIADIATDLSGLIAASVVTVGLGIWLWRRADKSIRSHHI